MNETSDSTVALNTLRLKESALNATANGVVITGVDGKIQWVNSAACQLTGYCSDEVIGRKHWCIRLPRKWRHDNQLAQMVRCGHVSRKRQRSQCGAVSSSEGMTPGDPLFTPSARSCGTRTFPNHHSSHLPAQQPLTFLETLCVLKFWKLR